MTVTVGSKLAEVKSIRVLATCASGQHDCSRFEVVFESPALESPGIKSAFISSGELEEPLAFSLEYVPPCDFVQFCQQLSHVFDYKTMLANPSVECGVAYCL
ncbi:MAG: hypothetical protein ACK55Z_00605, partial [bacterium]